MSYRSDLVELGEVLGDLLRDGGHVDPHELDLALAGHRAGLELVRTVFKDVCGIGSHREQLTIAELERRPVHVMARLLSDHPAAGNVPLTDALQIEPTTEAGRRWQRAARLATLTAHEWDQVPERSRPIRNEKWTELSEIASVAEGIGLLGRDLSESLREAGRHLDAERMHLASTSGLVTTSAEVRRLAMAGPLPPPTDLVPPVSRRVLVVRRLNDLPEAFDRLTAMVQGARELSPQHVQLVARALSLATLDAHRALEGVEPAVGLTALRTHADRLAEVAAAPVRVAALMPGDPRPLAQAQQIHEFMSAIRRTGMRLPSEQAVAIADRAAVVSTSLDAAVRGQLTNRRWLVHREQLDPTKPDWGPLRTGDPSPKLATAVKLASTSATEAITLITSPRPAIVARHVTTRLSTEAVAGLRTSVARPPRPAETPLRRANLARRWR